MEEIEKESRAISLSERVANMGIALINGIGVGCCATDTLWILTTEAAGMGMEVIFSVAILPYVLAGSIGGLLALAAVSSYLFYYEHQDATDDLIQAIQTGEQAHQEHVKYLEKLSDNYFKHLLRYYLLRSSGTTIRTNYLNQFLNDNQLAFDMAINELKVNNPSLIDKLKLSIKNISREELATCSSVATLQSLFCNVIHQQYRQSITPAQPKKAGPIKFGVISFFGGFGAILGTTWGLASVITSSITTLAIATPVIGWSMLAAAIVFGLVAGGVCAYLEYRNAKRQAVSENIRAENMMLKGQCDLLENDLRTDLKVVNGRLIEPEQQAKYTLIEQPPLSNSAAPIPELNTKEVTVRQNKNAYKL